MTPADDRLRDGRRIAALLASELDGRSDRGLDRVTVTDADPDVEPSPEGARAFDVAADGEPVATVFVEPERAIVALPTAGEAAAAAAAEAGMTFEAPTDGSDPPRLVVADGAAVKRAVAVLRTVLED